MNKISAFKQIDKNKLVFGLWKKPHKKSLIEIYGRKT